MTAITAPLATEPLWARVRATFARACAATGGAACIAAHITLSQRLRASIVGWIGLLEHLLRKLLYAEAARVRCDLASRPLARRPHCAGAARDDKAREPAPSRTRETPERWPARFSFAPPRDPRATPQARAPQIRALWGATPAPSPSPPPQPPSRAVGEHDKPFRLARRFEALRRVLDDPAPYIMRLAQLMARLSLRFPEAARRLAFAPARVNFFDAADPTLGVACCSAALAGYALFESG